MVREDIKKDNRDNLYLVIKELSLLSPDFVTQKTYIL